MKEHRKIERIKAVTFATLYDRKDHILLGFLGNLTTKGAMSIGDKPVKPDRDINLEIEFRGVTEIPDGRINTSAHISWCKFDDKTEFYHTGFEFLSLDEDLKPAIELLVARYRLDLNYPD